MERASEMGKTPKKNRFPSGLFLDTNKENGDSESQERGEGGEVGRSKRKGREGEREREAG